MVNIKDKIFPYSKAQVLQSKIKNKKVVVVGGCFDLLHYGHITFLQRAKEKGDVLLVFLESDVFIKKRKKRNSIHSQSERAEILASLLFVDYIIMLPLFDKTNYNELVMAIRPSVIAITEGDPHENDKKQHAISVGGTLAVVCPNIKEFSTSSIVKNYETIFSD